MIVNPIVEALLALEQVDKAVDPDRDLEEDELTDYQAAHLHALRGVGYAILALASGGQPINMEPLESTSLEHVAKSVFNK